MAKFVQILLFMGHFCCIAFTYGMITELVNNNFHLNIPFIQYYYMLLIPSLLVVTILTILYIILDGEIKKKMSFAIDSPERTILVMSKRDGKIIAIVSAIASFLVFCCMIRIFYYFLERVSNPEQESKLVKMFTPHFIIIITQILSATYLLRSAWKAEKRRANFNKAKSTSTPTN